MNKEEIIIIGGGLAGLTAAALLAKKGRGVLLIEKKEYPFHRVCGEYVSNEVRQFLEKEDLFPDTYQPAEISRFRLTSTKGRAMDMDLDLGGFGISRYHFDDFLYQKAKAWGVRFMLNTQAEQVHFHYSGNNFTLELSSGENLNSPYVLGAFGKRSKMDKALNRNFIKDRTPYIGVKYHIKGDFEKNLIALHNYKGGYCGINPIEGDRYCVCYLGDKKQLREFGNIAAMEQNTLYQNPQIRAIFENAEFLYEKPEVINEINFSPKLPVENHVLMIGDAAGMITPLCGNGMAIAIHTGKMVANALIQNSSRTQVEKQYAGDWERLFKNRLRVGRMVQKLFGAGLASELAVTLLRKSPFLGRQLMKHTHGTPF